ncbi:MAG TPA: Gfo/Idh/MocA family oxidoreductase [Abditibacteriaceae bacterium]|jgi:predicted dehydrogenase
MNIGFIGVGGVAQAHLGNLQKMKNVVIASVCDVDGERAQKAADTYGADCYEDYREMLNGEKLDAVYVCVIPGAHGNIELDLAKAGIPFFSEKPVGLDLNTCAKTIEAIEKTNCINAVGYHWRYRAGVQAARRFMEKHPISVVEGAWYGGFVGVPWWRQMSLSGGQIVEQSTHVFDLARYLAGEVHTVTAIGATGAMKDVSNYDIHDASIALLQFDSGAIGHITTGCLADNPNAGSQVEIAFKGLGWQARVANDVTLGDKKGLKTVPEVQSWQEQLGNGDKIFLNAIKNNSMDKVLSDYRSGAQTLAVTLAANQSIESGKAVKVRRF